MKKVLLIVIVLAVLAYGASFFPLEFLRPTIESAMARGLGRPVEIGGIHVDLLTGPGVTLDAVTIHEDTSAGIEPFAYAASVDARLDLFSLLRGRIAFSSIRFDDASVNLVKPDRGPWNLQTLLNQSPAQSGNSGTATQLPAIRVRGGRVNMKFGDTKSVLYFADTDLDIQPRGQDNIELRFSGVPARSDRAGQSVGHFFVNGTSQRTAKGRQLNLKIELEPTAADGVLSMFTRGGPDLKGAISGEASLAGPPEKLELEGAVRIDGGAEWRYKGALNLNSQSLNLENMPRSAPVRIAVTDLLGHPDWQVSLGGVELKGLLALGRQLGAPFSSALTAEGTVAGTFGYAATGMAANLEVQDASLMLPGKDDSIPTGALQVATATILAKNNRLVAGPFTTRFVSGNATSKDTMSQTAEVGAEFQTSAEGNEFGLTVVTKKLDFAALRVLPLETTDVAALTLLKSVTSGAWKGTLRYAQALHQVGQWTGDYELQDTSVAIEGLAEPVRIQSASVAATPQQVTISKLRASAGSIAFTGDYTWNAAAAAVHAFHLQVPQAQAADLEKLFLPALTRESGGLSRALRIGSGPPPPGWLATRKAEGTIAFQTLRVEGHRLRMDASPITWDGSTVRITAKNARLNDNTSISGELAATLTGAKPAYEFTGKLEELPYKGGRLELSGRVTTAGFGRELLATARAEGDFKGRSITFSPEARFRQTWGRFTLKPSQTGAPDWTLDPITGDNLTGSGTTEADGTLLLELTGGGKQVKYRGTTGSAAPRD